jgi:hypothetical protein
MESFLLKGENDESNVVEDVFAAENSFVECDNQEVDVALLHALDGVLAIEEALTMLPENIQKKISEIE